MPFGFTFKSTDSINLNTLFDLLPNSLFVDVNKKLLRSKNFKNEFQNTHLYIVLILINRKRKNSL